MTLPGTRPLRLGELELSKGETQALLAAFVELTARLDDSRIAELEAMIAARREGSSGAKAK